MSSQSGSLGFILHIVEQKWSRIRREHVIVNSTLFDSLKISMVQLQISTFKVGRSFTVDVGEDATILDVKSAIFAKNKKVTCFLFPSLGRRTDVTVP